MQTAGEPLRVGIAGLGFGCTEFLPVLERMPEIRLVAGADIRPQALQTFQKRYGGRVYDSVEGLCEDPDVEAVWISTPEGMHADHSLMAVQRGKHVVIRKPMALTPEECQRVLDAAERTGAKILAGGQTQGTNPLVRHIRSMLNAGELGRLCAINMWAYTGWMLSARTPKEVDESMGGGIIWRQLPHQIETIRWLGGGMLRSVRAGTGRWLPARPNASGYLAAYLEFEDGTPVTVVYNGYGYFDSVELVKWGSDRGMERRITRRKALMSGQVDELKEKEAERFGGLSDDSPEPVIPWERPGHLGSTAEAGPRPWLPGNQGVWVVSCERGDIRMSPEGLYVYDDEGLREVKIPQRSAAGMEFLDAEAMEMVNAVRRGVPVIHDGRWGMATAEVQWALIRSGRERREILLQHQVPVPQGH